MAVEPDRRARDLVDPGSLEPLADAVRTAAPEARVAEVLQALVDAAAQAAGAEVALARVLDPSGSELVVRAVTGPSRSLGAELEGGRLPLADLPEESVELDEAPEAVRRIAERLGADQGFLVPVILAGETIASIELFRADTPFGDGERAAARIAAAQVGLAVRAFTPPEPPGDRPSAEAVLAAGAAFAAASDVGHAPSHVLRLAVDLSGAQGGVVWRGAPPATQTVWASSGRVDEAPTAPSPGHQVVGETESLAFGLGEPPFGLLQLLFARGRAPAPELAEALHAFAVRAADVLRVNEAARELGTELEQTRALLAVVGQAAEQLSVAHTLDTAIARIAELVGVERIAVYLVEDMRLTIAAERGLAGPHTRAAEALLGLAVSSQRGRPMLVVPDAAAEPRLAGVADAVAEAGIEGAIALPLVVGDEVTGILCVYSPRGRTVDPDEATLLSAVAGRLAVAVQNARLHEQATRLGEELEHALASEREAARQLGALYEISRAFAQSLSLDVTLDAVARTVVELLDVDAALLRMPDPRREQLLPLALHVREERLQPAIRSMLMRPQPFGSSLAQSVFRGGGPASIDAEAVAELGGSHSLLLPFLEQGATAAVVPVATPAEVLASLTLLSLRPDRPIGAEIVEAAVAIASQAALAIDNARLYQHQKDFADAMQRSLLPQVRPPVEGLDIGEVYAPSAVVEVGGDLYDYLALEDGRLAVVVGDVTGHGIDAAADMAMAKYVFRSLAREHPEPGDFLAAANEVVCGEIAPGKFITMLYLLIDPLGGAVVCASAGHPPPRLVDAAGRVSSIDARGLALGVEPGMHYDEVGATLEAGGSVVLYTDGVIEARTDFELYGVERLDALLARRYALRAEDIAASVIQSARRHTGGELSDDCAVVVLKRR